MLEAAAGGAERVGAVGEVRAVEVAMALAKVLPSEVDHNIEGLRSTVLE